MADLITLSALTLDPGIMQGRLTLETGVAISATDQTAKTSVFLTPYRGNRLALYDGTTWKMYAYTADVTLALGTLTSGKNYDVFAFDSSSNVALEFSAAWTNDTTRADALAFQDGILCKSGALTRRYLGTIRTTSTTTTEDSLTSRYVWNAYNHTLRALRKTDSTSHSYTSAVSRAWNNAATNAVSWVQGLLAANATIAGIMSEGHGDDTNTNYTYLDLNGTDDTPEAFAVTVSQIARGAYAKGYIGRLGLNTLTAKQFGNTGAVFNIYVITGGVMA